MHLEIYEILTVIYRVNSLFYNIVNNSSTVWKNIQFNHCVCVDSTALKSIKKHPRNVEKLLLPYSIWSIKTFELDFVLAHSNLKKLRCLNIAEAPLSTLCFIHCSTNLKVVDVSGCSNLCDRDFEVLVDCSKLEKLYVSFTSISPERLKCICNRKSFTILDACNVQLQIVYCENILSNIVGTLLSMHISLCPSVNRREFNRRVSDIFFKTSVHIHELQV